MAQALAPKAKPKGAGSAHASAPSKKNRTWRRRAEARPDEILDAALDEFIAQGFDAARMEDIAARAGISKGAIYLYFSGKEALLRGLIEREVAPVMQRVAALAHMGAADPRATLRSLMTMMAQVMGQARVAAIPFLVVSIANRFPDIVDYYRREVIDRGRGALEALIAKGVALGQFRKVDPKVASRALIGPMMFEVIWAHVLKGPNELGKSGKWIDAQFDVLMRGLEKRA